MSAFYKTYHMPEIPKAEQAADPKLKYKKKFTESEINTIARMRKNGASWDACGSAIGRTGESCYKAMKNRTYKANKALQQSRQKPSEPAAPKKAPENNRLRRMEIQIRALTATLALIAIVILLMAVKVI